MANYAWHITHDHLENRVVDIKGPDGVTPDNLARCNVQFRLYDDDGVLYYSGWMTEECDFEPLDDYGMPAAGCTWIHVFENGEWRPL